MKRKVKQKATTPQSKQVTLTQFEGDHITEVKSRSGKITLQTSMFVADIMHSSATMHDIELL
jgi:hypothetical protein